MFSRAAFQARANIPPPIIAQPSGSFDGNDGSWSSFVVRVGTPGQDSKMLISTLVPETWVVIEQACNAGANTNTNCTTSRGGDPSLFDSNSSSTWQFQNTYSFAVDSNIGISQTTGGNYAYDTLGIEQVGGGSNSVLTNQVVSGFATNSIWLGNVGLAQRTSNFQSNNTQPSYIQSLNNANKIPSISYSYTAGAYYRSKTNASLILGGYDASRFSFPSFSIQLANDPINQLMVGVQKIEYSDSTGQKSSLLDSGILMLLDSTLPNIWLPQSACDAMASAFGLTYDQYHSQYTINDTQRMANYQNGATVNFTLGQSISGGSTTVISFPYGAFDLNYTNPTQTDGNATSYFPLKPSSNSAAWTLGRAFFQEAVVTVDYTRKNFTVAQALPVTSKTQTNVIPIINGTTSGSGSGSSSGGSSSSGSGSGSGSGSDGSSGGSSGGIGGGAIAGIVIGVLAAFAIAGAAFYFFFWKKRNTRKGSDGSSSSSSGAGKGTEVTAINEMPLAKGHQDLNTVSPPPQYGAPDYFGAGAKDGISPGHTPGQQQQQQQQQQPPPMAAHQPLIPHVNQYTGVPELPSPSHGPAPTATITNLDYQNAYNNGFLSPANVPANVAGAAGPGAAAAAAAAAGIPIAELAGSTARDRPHELHSNTSRSELASPASGASGNLSELASPDLNAHEMPTSTSASVSPSPGAMSPNLAAIATTSAPQGSSSTVPVSEMGTSSPIDPVGTTPPSNTTISGNTAGSAALAPAAAAATGAAAAVAANRGSHSSDSTEREAPNGSHHRAQRSSATLPSPMAPRIQENGDNNGDDRQALPPLPSNAATNITAAELATRPMSSATTTTIFSDGAMTPSPNDEDGTGRAGYFHDTASESGISRNTSIMSATSARVVRPTMVQQVQRSGSPEATRIGTIGEDREGEERENTPER